MNKEEFEKLSSHNSPILSLNKKIGSVQKKTLLSLSTIDTDGEILDLIQDVEDKCGIDIKIGVFLAFQN